MPRVTRRRRSMLVNGNLPISTTVESVLKPVECQYPPCVEIGVPPIFTNVRDLADVADIGGMW
jgi:hypothetical protein